MFNCCEASWDKVARHFNLPNHSKQHMAVCGLSLHLGNSESRKTLEQKFIFQIGTLNPHRINERSLRLGHNCRNSLSHWSRTIVNKVIDNENDVPCNTTLVTSEKKIIYKINKTIGKLKKKKCSKL